MAALESAVRRHQWMVAQPGRRTAAITVAAALAFIAAMTLQPARASRTLATFCLICGPQGGVDFLLNTVLFIPLGVGLRWLLGDWKRPIFLGVLTTLFVETLQFRFVPGRDASLGDLLSNSVGTALGAWLAIAAFRWLAASGHAARRLAVAYGLFVSAVFSVSTWFLLPAPTRRAQYVQWTPQRPNTDLFKGRVTAVALNGLAIRPDETLAANRLLNGGSISVQVTVLGPVPPSSRRAIITHIADPDEEGFSLAQRGDDLLFRTHNTAASFRFRPLVVKASNAFSTADSDGTETSREITINAVSDSRAVTVRTSQAGTSTVVALRRTVGLGWALLYPWDLALTPASWPVNAAWLATLLVPVAFFSLRTARRTSGDSRHTLTWWPSIVVVVSIFVLPFFAGLSWLSPGEMLGGILGVLAGAVLERMTATGVPPSQSPKTTAGA